jgi:hypothetical protein
MQLIARTSFEGDVLLTISCELEQRRVIVGTLGVYLEILLDSLSNARSRP